MNAIVAPAPDNESSNIPALVLSALVHLLLIGALFFGVQWKSQAPSAVQVEIWRSLPPAPVVQAEPVPETKQEPKPEPKPEPKSEPKPQPKPEPVKPDIAIKDKKPEPKKPEPKPEPKKEEPRKAEPPKRVDLSRELANEQKQLDQQKAMQEQRERANTEAALLAQLKAEQASSAKAIGLANYIAKIRGKIRGNIMLPQSIQGNPEAIFQINQLPTGEVINVKLLKSSGNAALDAAVERAILKSSPLPKPDNASDFDRELKIPYRPVE